jgi:signal transduction histidine kinase
VAAGTPQLSTLWPIRRASSVTRRWRPTWARPRYWGIPARSAFLSATVVLVALTVAGAGLVAVLDRSLLSGLDAAAVARVQDLAAALQLDPPADLDARLLSTDQRIVAVQIVDSSGAVLQRSRSAPAAAFVPVNTVGPTLRIGIHDNGSVDGDMRIAAQTVTTPGGRYTLLVGAGTETVESTVRTVAVGLALAAPIVIAVSGAATYLLVGRSLRSVEAIRARVAEISASDLSERVPVPEHRDEISALATTMNAMLSRLESGQAAHRRFIGDASHELRSPLATVISALEVGAAHPELLNKQLATTTMLPEAYRMESLVEDLLLLARADERGLPVRRDDIDLDDLVTAEIGRLQRQTQLTIDVDVTPARIVGDAAGLSRLLRNLLDNAARHADSRIEIAVSLTAGHAELTIADDGPGIPAYDRVRVFDRFVRLDTDRSRSGGGAGLGLAIVAEIVAAHDGRVHIEDRGGGGTVVVVQLPLAKSPDSSR